MQNFSITDVIEEMPLISILDVGAMKDDPNRYQTLLDRGLATVVGFEPRLDALAKLEGGENEFYLPHAVGSGSQEIFYECRHGGCSSIYKPSPPHIDSFTSIGTSEGANFEIVGEAPITTVRLDEIEQLTEADYLYIDVQGAELDVLKGAEKMLGDVAVIDLEVEFVPLYENQPLFADVDRFMRAHGFLIHKLIDVSGRPFKPFLLNDNPAEAISQLLWADAVYVPNFTRFAETAPQRLLKTAIILHEVYDSYDLAALALAAREEMTGDGVYGDYLKSLKKNQPLVHSFMNVRNRV
jgi:FkbM family methyltransferase